ncbi:uncharacterized protein (DUF885 family) [Luteibacter rhizovicinus]|uniref:Uncharacterized protein (DUF885 family) n=1 Tax=Luteibacter rhizovicinus TaxID=242606 RepID=A0A4R3YNV1_9GAMM|nr:DUF885 domain-containing protein [Luteibacter rhizovicinus]TCV93218.1 uncharacterized protein (DUF885 family) [Luteibacter rhizovicinus]
MPKLSRTLLSAALVLALPTFAHAAEPAQAVQPASQSDKTFMALADAYFDGFYFPNNPTAATTAGIHRYDGQLENASKAGIDAQVKALRDWESRFAAVAPKTLGEQVAGDRELLLNSVRGQLLTLTVIKPWEKNPDFYSSGIASSAFTLMARKFASADDRMRSLVSREKHMLDTLAAARTNLVNPPKIYTEIALEQLPGLLTFFQNDVPAAFVDVKDAALRKEFDASNGAVIKALDDYQTWLKSDVLPRSKGDFRIGADTYRKKLAYDEMVDTPLDKLVAIDMENMRANQREFARVAKELDPTKTPAQVLADLAADHPPGDKLLDTFRASFDKLIGFIEDKGIITIPSKVRPILEETPPFMRATTFASMDTPGPYETVAKEAYFNVTLPEAGWDKQRTDDFMAQFSYPVISSVAVHEAYPGHYIQFLWMHQVDDRVRKLVGANSNAEGWAHYCEQMMLDEGFAQALYPNDPRQQKLLKLGQLQDALLRNARFIVGIKMHSGQMTFDQAVDFFVKEGYQSRGVGLIETKRGTSDPTYLYYTLGKLEILKLRADLQAKQGAKFDVHRFHDDFMRQGFAPIKIVRRAMLHDDSAPL